MNNEQNFPNCMLAVTIICESTLCGLTFVLECLPPPSLIDDTFQNFEGLVVNIHTSDDQ